MSVQPEELHVNQRVRSASRFRIFSLFRYRLCCYFLHFFMQIPGDEAQLFPT